MSVLLEFFEEKEIRGRKVKVAIRQMTEEQAREAYPYRPFDKYAESHFGGNTLYDDVCMLLNRFATRCCKCGAPTRNEFLQDETCPDCDGRAELNGMDPHKK